MTATSEPTSLPSPLPNRPKQEQTTDSDPSKDVQRPNPKLRLNINDLRHPSSKSFLALVPDPASTLETALDAIIKYLYTSPPKNKLDPRPKTRHPSFKPSIPPTRSVTLILHDFSGVAYTNGTELDDDHKEIHFSLSYIRHCTTLNDPPHEIAGVLTHELVHCYQHTAPPGPEGDGVPRPPGGLIEGVSDFVRLKAGLDPPHWKRPTSSNDRGAKWDQGYQHTAYFLAWLEDVRIGTGAIGMLNDRLLRVGYVGDEGKREGEGNGFWKALFGAGVLELWEEYGRYLDTIKS